MSVPVLVLIASHGRPSLLGRTLRSVAACARPERYAGCVVVENGPAAGAAAVVAEVSAESPGAGLSYRHEARANKSAALNAALGGVPAETLVVYLDDDVRVSPGLLAAYAEAAGGRRGQAFFGGPTRVDYERPPEPWLIRMFPASARGMDVTGPDAPEWFLGFNWASYAGDVVAAGGFDPNYGPGSPIGARGQETNMQNRLKDRGLIPVPVPDAVVWHWVPTERSSPEWVIQRRYQLGMSAGQKIARGERTNTIPREVAKAVRSLALLPPFWALRNVPRVTGHRATISRAAGLLRGYAAARWRSSSTRP